MNNTLKVIVTSAITALVIALGVVAFVGHQAAQSNQSFGTQVQNDLFYFTGGIKVGGQGQFNVDTSGNITTSGELLTTGATSAGGVAAANQITVQATAKTFYPSAAAITLSGYQNTTSTTSTLVTFPFGTAQGFAVGDLCADIAFNNVPTSTPFGADAFLSQVSTTTATATVTLWNGNSASITFNTTSSIAGGASSTLKITCRHTGI